MQELRAFAKPTRGTFDYWKSESDRWQGLVPTSVTCAEPLLVLSRTWQADTVHFSVWYQGQAVCVFADEFEIVHLPLAHARAMLRTAAEDLAWLARLKSTHPPEQIEAAILSYVRKVLDEPA